MRASRGRGQRMLFAVVLSVLAMAGSDGAVARAQSGGVLLYGVTPSNRLIAFSSAAPGQLLSSVAISNLAPGERILGIDVRPATNYLYALGSTSQLYVLNPVNGAALRVGGPFTPALAGTDFGFDFNPAVDRIRVVSDAGQNLRLHPDTGAVVATDGALTYGPGDPNQGRAPAVSAAAYTNPDTNPSTGTTLYDIDIALGVVAVQNPPNDGRLNTVMALGVAAASVGFDIGITDFYAAIQAPGATSSALMAMSGSQRLMLGTIGGGEPVPSLAVSLGAPFSAPAGRVFATTAGNELIGFDAGSASTILSRVAISGLAAGERLVGIDFRPANNLLYGLGSSSQLYIIDAPTGLATRVGPPLTTPLAGSEFGFDFNPTVDRIRVVSDSGQNLRLHPDTGGVAAVDGPLAYATTDPNAGRTPRVVGAAYTNPDNNPATGTTLFVLDAGLDVGVVQDPPNAGVLNTFQALGADAGEVLGFDISPTQILIVVAPTAAAPSTLFDVTSGARRNLGLIGSGEIARGLAISLGR
jgi:hypothetical protein